MLPQRKHRQRFYELYQVFQFKQYATTADDGRRKAVQPRDASQNIQDCLQPTVSNWSILMPLKTEAQTALFKDPVRTAQ